MFPSLWDSVSAEDKCNASENLFKLFLLFVQSLYFCVPFREQLLEYYANNKTPSDAEENLLTCLADLFLLVSYLLNWQTMKSDKILDKNVFTHVLYGRVSFIFLAYS